MLVFWFGGFPLSALPLLSKVVEKLDNLTERVDALGDVPDGAGGAPGSVPRGFPKAKAKGLSLQERSLLGKRKRQEKKEQVPKKKNSLFEFSPVASFPLYPTSLCKLLRKSPQYVEDLA